MGHSAGPRRGASRAQLQQAGFRPRSRVRGEGTGQAATGQEGGSAVEVDGSVGNRVSLGLRKQHGAGVKGTWRR